jgi:circadian clock protein KaiB
MTEKVQEYSLGEETCILKLYIAGATRHSLAAVTNITKICETYLSDNYELEVIDIYQQPELAQSEQIVAAPTLIRYSPEPTRRLIGDLSDITRVMMALGLEAI